MADLLMTKSEKDNIEAIIDMAAKLPNEAQKQLYYISVGLAFGNNVIKSNNMENGNAESSTN